MPLKKERELTQARLKELLSYDPERGLFFWIKRTSNRVKIGDEAGSLRSSGYHTIFIDGIAYPRSSLAYLYVNGEYPTELIDHRNRVPTDDRIDNLRKADYEKNAYNTKIHRDNKSGYKGVYFCKLSNKWRAQMRVGGKKYHLGLFTSPELASEAYQEASKEKHGEFYNGKTK